MTIDIHEASGRGPRRFRPRIVTALFVVCLVVLLFVLARTMVVHRFHRGGWVGQGQRVHP
jgi:hypothetical protein